MALFLLSILCDRKKDIPDFQFFGVRYAIPTGYFLRKGRETLCSYLHSSPTAVPMGLPEKGVLVPAPVQERGVLVPVQEKEVLAPVPVQERGVWDLALEQGVLGAPAVRNHRSCTLCVCGKEIVTR